MVPLVISFAGFPVILCCSSMMLYVSQLPRSCWLASSFLILCSNYRGCSLSTYQNCPPASTSWEGWVTWTPVGKARSGRSSHMPFVSFNAVVSTCIFRVRGTRTSLLFSSPPLLLSPLPGEMMLHLDSLNSQICSTVLLHWWLQPLTPPPLVAMTTSLCITLRNTQLWWNL